MGKPNSLRTARRDAPLTQLQLAEAVGVSRQTIANIERGDYSPSVHLALNICRCLNKTVEEVFGEKQPIERRFL
ncbi:helix-turn-helix transcriptional regulator [Corynebacterium resistens]|uniref:helix-turn-helix transcriptional regulator n=1 Tax=Corynebacterium resistens TaxID=258224 RepID=UPI0001E28FC1|nr:helix-turn-helix transcriptional regulator [Corynebacterium resistens]